MIRLLSSFEFRREFDRDYPFIERYIHQKWRVNEKGYPEIEDEVVCPVTKWVEWEGNRYESCPVCRYANQQFVTLKESNWKDADARRKNRDFTDVRLVFAIPKSMGKFGGETDNWMWPRQTCDFSVFRVYCDPKTGGPAKYSKDNVPYHPAVWARVSNEGYKEGDFAMTMGYPGSTERYLSSFGIQLMRDAENAPRYQVRTVRQDVMLRHMRQDEAVRIKYDSKYANSANYWKNALGMNKCIDSVGIIGLKQQHERLIQQYQDSTGYLKGQLDIKLLGDLYAKITTNSKTMTIFTSDIGPKFLLSGNKSVYLLALSEFSRHRITFLRSSLFQ